MEKKEGEKIGFWIDKEIGGKSFNRIEKKGEG